MLSLDSLFSFRGRIGRAGYWLVGFLQLVLLCIAFGVTIAAASADGLDRISSSIVAVWVLGGLVFCWIGLAATVKRWHDRDKSAWWILMGAVPMIGPLWVLIELGFLPGTPGGNRFGPTPGSPIGSWSDAEVDDGFDPDAVVSAWKSASAAVPAVAVPRRAPHQPVVRRTTPPAGGFGRRGLT